MQVALDARGVYFQPARLGLGSLAMCIPYGRFRLIAKPTARTASFSLGTYGIFKVDGVDIWLDQPYADQLIEHLQP